VKKEEEEEEEGVLREKGVGAFSAPPDDSLKSAPLTPPAPAQASSWAGQRRRALSCGLRETELPP